MANQESQSEPERSIERTENPTAIARPSRGGVAWPFERWSAPGGPFSLMRQLTDDMDRMFDQFLGSRPWGRERGLDIGELTSWPELEVYRRGDKLVVRADLPGLSKDDVSVEVRDNDICISGERRHEEERKERDYYRSERSYGRFCRTIPLPEGAKADTASASFKNGVLEVEIETPSQAPQGRKIEVREEAPH